MIYHKGFKQSFSYSFKRTVAVKVKWNDPQIRSNIFNCFCTLPILYRLAKYSSSSGLQLWNLVYAYAVRWIGAVYLNLTFKSFFENREARLKALRSSSVSIFHFPFRSANF